jgi:hypothetical protein
MVVTEATGGDRCPMMVVDDRGTGAAGSTQGPLYE